MSRLDRCRAGLGLALVVAIGSLALGRAPVRAQSGGAIADREFWRLLTGLSEDGGVFAPQLMSNEDSAQFVVPALKDRTRPGGIYIGVGSEQNFTYLAALQPKLAFVVDIRRDNMLELLMYKSLFELSSDRADFVSRLFARRRPAGLDATSSVSALFGAFGAVRPDAAYLEQNVHDVLTNLTGTHAFPLSQIDQSTISGMMETFRTAGPDELKGWGDRTNPTYTQLMEATDLAGRQHGFLASEEHYRGVRTLERNNLVVPVVGDFSGDKALAGIARYLAERRAVVDVFYVSNVERYLFEQGAHGKQFYANLAAMPLGRSSVFVRSVTRDISQRLGIPVPPSASKWWTFLFSMQECLSRVRDGRIKSYPDLFVAPL